MALRSYGSSSGVSKIRPIISLIVVVVLMGLSYYVGSKNTYPMKEEVAVVNPVEVSPPLKIENSKATKQINMVKNLGIFNNERYFLKWSETWLIDDNKPQSNTSAVLEKYVPASDEAIIVGQNIVLSDDAYVSIDGVSNISADTKSVVLRLSCENCTEDDFLTLNLESGRAMHLKDLLGAVKMRSKMPVCNYVPFNNFTQNNLLFICKNAEGLESLYKYHLSTYAVSEVEILKESETFVCSNKITEFYSSVYSKDNIVINVCAKVKATTADVDKNLHEIKVDDRDKL